MNSEDFKYHLRREIEERSLAEKATDPAVRDAHSALADNHGDKAREFQENR